MSNNQDFVIEQQKRTVVNDYKSKIEKLFNVRVKFANGGSADGMLWIGLTGDEEQRTKAKDYIKALTSPEQKCTVLIPDSLLPVLGANTKEHFELEAEYGVVVSFPEEKKALIAGSAVGVTCAASKLEDLIKENRGKTTNVAPKARGSEANPNRALEDFALKLGYEQAEITVVFEKLGGTVDRNTFLNELIKLSNQRSRAVEDRRSPIPVQGGGATFCSTYAREAYGRHPGDMVATKGLPSGGLNMMSGINARGFRPDTFIPDNGVVSRGVIPRATVQSSRTGSTPSPMYTNTNSDFNSLYPSNGSYMTAGNDFSQVAIDPRQLDQMYQDLMTNSVRKQFPQSDLRHIVIDGSNVAMSHGNNKVFSCKGIRLCVDWFRARGHKDITVFVPQWRKESAKRESPITDQHLLNQLEDQGYLKFTPSRRINGRRIVCYDDRFVVRLAESTDGIIVSNDNFKDLSQENPKWREVIESRLLMYSFVNDMFMPPDDPLGRDGPTLDEFLHKGMSNHHRRVCPYGRRCTYGTRCKYHHPEREDNRLPLYQTLKDMFPNQEALILSILKSYPQERDVQRLATMVLDKLS